MVKKCFSCDFLQGEVEQYRGQEALVLKISIPLGY